MSSMSNYLKGELIKHIFRTGSFTKPTALYLALYTAPPTDAGGGTEVAGGNYARAQLNPADANWTDQSAGDGQTDNGVAITFPTPSADWGRVTHYAIFDAAAAGNMLMWDALTASKNINNGDPGPVFPIGALTATFS